MKKTDFKVTFWGTQGSTAVSGPKKRRYGCNTPCISVECGGRAYVFDFGTGFLPFSNYFMKNYWVAGGSESVDLFISHYHLDHIEGLPFAGMTYTPNIDLRFHGPSCMDKPPAEVLSGIFSPPYFPMRLIEDAKPGRFTFNTITPQSPVPFDDGIVKVEYIPVPHPGGSLSYKLTYNGRSFCYLSDFEYDGNLTEELYVYLRGCELTAFDAYFSNDNLISGWGHSTWEQGVEIWRQAELKQMVMYHHHIACGDKDLDALNATLADISADLFIAKDGMTIYL